VFGLQDRDREQYRRVTAAILDSFGADSLITTNGARHDAVLDVVRSCRQY